MIDPGEISFDKYDLAWTGVSPKDISRVMSSGFNPLDNRTQLEVENPGMREMFLMSQCPEYIYFACKALLNREISPMQACMLYMMWVHPFPMLIASRGASKTSLLAYYAILRAALIQGSKIVCVGASFRQSKFLHAYAEDRFMNSPVLRSIFRKSTDGTKSSNDMIQFRLGDSVVYFLPLGSGEKIRGLRGNVIIADEMNSIDTEVYEIVINNFASVSMNPIEQMKRRAKIKAMSGDGLEIPEELIDEGFKNQSIIAGTMGYEFQPMYEYWQKYKKIIDSRGESLKEVFEDDVDLNYKDFCIMRLPYELIPKGFMDDKTIARAKATIHIGAYNSEYGCVPVKDSTGFFKRSVIEACVSNPKNVGLENWPDWCPGYFDNKTKGSEDGVYVMGIDPASEQDNLAIVICQVFPEHQRVVYCWTTNRAEVKKKDPNLNYWSFVARKIRDLCSSFNIETIGIDSQGGGVALSEALHDKTQLDEGEVAYWPVIEPGKRQDTDMMSGEHNLKMINFSNYQWLSSSNHNMLKDLESKTLLFPRYDSVILGLAGEANFGDEDLESCIINTEELKDELSTIVMTQTKTRQRWDTPDTKVGNKVGKMRKDRYSALLIANSVARDINKFSAPEERVSGEGMLVGTQTKPNEGPKEFYVASDPRSLKDFGGPGNGYGAVIRY